VQQQASIGRGQLIFNTRPMIISNVVGFNNFPGLTNSVPATCNTCHGANGGNDALPRNQRNIGISGDAVQFGGPALANDLPIFQLTCKPGFSTVFGGVTVQTNDPGLALITGKCSDIGRTSVPQLRALSARAPYFSNGLAATLMDVVNFYNTRFSIGYSDQEKQDLVNFLRTL
jgi:cytochrome c peroxidase